MQTVVIRCPDCGEQFERALNDVGLEEFITLCPACGEDCNDSHVVGETGGPKPIKLISSY